MRVQYRGHQRGRLKGKLAIVEDFDMSFSKNELVLDGLTSDTRHSVDIGEAQEQAHKSSGNGRGQRHFGNGFGVGEAGIRERLEVDDGRLAGWRK